MQKIILAGHYQVVKHLGGGGFGQTFLAKDNHLPGKPLCVVKQLKPQVSDGESLKIAKRLFDREAETLYRLGNHDRIPRLLAHFQQDEEFYLVQDFIEGQPLDKEITLDKQFSESYAIELLQDILLVLSFVHQHNVIHRDIKPANLIRRSFDGKIVLIDFGAVKEVSSQTTHGQTSLTVAVGSLGYMPSEQQAFRPKLSSDVYAVGILILCALSGLSPNSLPEDPQTGEICCAALREIVSVSPGLAAILDKMVRYDYRDRYLTATEANEAVSQLIAPGQQKPGDIATVLRSRESEQAPTPREMPQASLVSSLNSEFIDRCRSELARCIGPFASFIIEDTIVAQPQISPQELVKKLAAEIPNPEKAKQFENNLL